MSSQKPADAAADGPVPKAVVSRLSLYSASCSTWSRWPRDDQFQPAGRAIGLLRRPGAQGPGLLWPFRLSGNRLSLRRIDRGDSPDSRHRSRLVGGNGRHRQLGPGPVGLSRLRQPELPHRRRVRRRPGKSRGRRSTASACIISTNWRPWSGRNQIKLGHDRRAGRHAQAVADRLVAAGIEGIVNFVPVTLSLPPGISLVAVDLAIELEQLSFAVANRP